MKEMRYGSCEVIFYLSFQETMPLMASQIKMAFGGKVSDVTSSNHECNVFLMV